MTGKTEYPLQNQELLNGVASDLSTSLLCCLLKRIHHASTINSSSFPHQSTHPAPPVLPLHKKSQSLVHWGIFLHPNNPTIFEAPNRATIRKPYIRECRPVHTVHSDMKMRVKFLCVPPLPPSVLKTKRLAMVLAKTPLAH